MARPEFKSEQSGFRTSFPFPWRRKWQPTPVRLPGKSHGQRSLVGCSPWGHYESDTTETGTQVSWQLPALQVDSLPLSLQGSRDTVYRVSNKNLSRHSKYIPSCILREIFFFLVYRLLCSLQPCKLEITLASGQKPSLLQLLSCVERHLYAWGSLPPWITLQ